MGIVTVVAKSVFPRLFMSLVAERNIAVGEQVLNCRGASVSAVRTWRTVQLDHGVHLQNEVLDYVNHSCEPNCVVDAETPAILAIRDIPKGESITIYYPGSEVELTQPFNCECGKPGCQGTVKGAFYLTHEQMCAAIERGYCTSFIKRELLRLLDRPSAQRAVESRLQP